MPFTTDLPKFKGNVWLLLWLDMSFIFCTFAVFEYVACNCLLRVAHHVDKIVKELKSKQAAEAPLSSAAKAANFISTSAPSASVPQEERKDVPQGKVQLEQACLSDLGSLPTTSASQEKPKDAPHEKGELDAANLRSVQTAVAGRMGACLINDQGKMRVTAQHLDIFSRIMFPVAFFTGVLAIRSWS